MTSAPSRFQYIDLTKGIGILTVVWAHIMLVGWSHRLIYAFHMPLFFFVSGFLFKAEKFASFTDFLKKRFKRLMIPYAIYSVATWAVWAVFRYITHSDVESYFMPLLQTVIAQGSGEFMVHNSALWFIPCLFAVEIIYFFIRKTGEIASLALCVAIAALNYLMACIFGDAYMYGLPWNLDAAFYALPFYALANIVHKHYSHEQILGLVKRNRIATLLTTAALGAALCLLAFNFQECSMGSSSYQCHIGIFFVRAFIGCFALIMLCALITSVATPRWITNALSWCGKNSLDIMCLHIPVKGIAMILVSKALHPAVDVSESGAYSAIAFVMTMVVCTVLIYGINKYIRHQ
ncbi:MAG: acyltransferase family protein [Bacteroidales bacterium]|nr:acyltransferase family protein [Bacteroidales bacterium]